MIKFRINAAMLLLSAVCFISSCTPYYYAPVTQNMPLHREKNEFNATVSTGDMFAFSASYSPGNHVALLGSFGSLKAAGESDVSFASYSYTSSIRNYEFGGGYFKALGENGSFEIYGLGGGGKVKIDDEYFYYDERIGYYKFALQPSIGVKNEWLEVGFCPKFTYLYFTNYHSDYFSQFNAEQTILEQLNNDGGRFVFEPAVMARIGFEHVKLFGLVCIPYSMENDYFQEHIYPWNIAIGITASFSTKKKTSNQ
ncbi:MAG TPA: hypothetical protein VFW78_00355 [Bacteroidia bacterium]|nr:hypothetical protein [Bacteroidia bacterium]